MAELAVVGLVGNVISFIDFGSKLVSATRDVHNSLHGTTAEVDELTYIVSNIQSSNERVKTMQTSGQHLSQDETNVLKLAEECEKLAKKMQKVLDKLRKRTTTSWKTYEDLRVAFQTLIKRKDLDDLRVRLEALDERIRSCFVHTLQANRHSATIAQLDRIVGLQKSLEINYDGKLNEIRAELINLMQQNTKDAQQRTAYRLLQMAKLSVLQEEHTACLRQTRVIPSLYVPPGSGKSTLMKYASESCQTIQALEQWAAPSKLFTASYYFWNQGFELQKSQRGLFQSLLYQILRAAPTLEKHITLGRLDHEAWEMHDLEIAFQKIAHATLDAKFCNFIDGLDEYDGRESEVVGVLELLTRSSNIKVYVSSRYRSIFEHEIRGLRHTIDISGYTKTDMANHVRNSLLEEAKFKRLHASNRVGCEKIVNDIAEHARGVWLWVALVTKDLVHAVKTGEHVEKLQEITKDFPKGLDKYFERMINDINPSYQVDMAKMFLLAIT
ncbi:hypothetical protein EJ07DRAFT_178797 [Lizonia empirigonia]|nr:hypothetical protein EJ07DRAFT_178797 [Lizonia empirigonia]